MIHENCHIKCQSLVETIHMFTGIDSLRAKTLVKEMSLG